MMEDPLERFLRSESERLQSLPSEEREKRLEEICRALEERVAGYIESGYEESAAVQAAIDSLASVPAAAGRLIRPSPALMPKLYCAVAFKACCVVADHIICRVVLRSGPGGYIDAHGLQALGWGNDYEPSAVIALIAAVIILFRDGLPKALRTIVTPGTVASTGILWAVWQQSIRVTLYIVLDWLARRVPDGGNVPPGILSAMIVVGTLMMVTPFLAGWVIGRRLPMLSVEGVRVAASAAFILTMADIVRAILIYGDGGFLLQTAALFFIGTLAAVFFGLGVTGARVGSRR